MIVPIDNGADPRLDAYRHVGDHRWLSERHLFVAEGRLIVQRTIAAGRFEIDSVLMTPAALRALEDGLREVVAPVYVLPPAALSGVTGFNFHRGCLALVRRPAPHAIDEIEGAGLLLGLEGIGNPDNIGGLFRTAAAFAAGGIVLDRTCADPYYRKALRTSMGAVLDVPFARVEDWAPATLARFRQRGFVTVALTPDPAAEPLDRRAAASGSAVRLILLVGSEGAGLSRTAMDAADHRVRIPMAPGVDSLNVTVAAGVALSRFSSLLS